MIIFSENKNFFDLNEIVNVVRQKGTLPPKKGTFENLGGHVPPVPPFLRHCQSDVLSGRVYSRLCCECVVDPESSYIVIRV
jgi:hypothetical protein